MVCWREEGFVTHMAGYIGMFAVALELFGDRRVGVTRATAPLVVFTGAIDAGTAGRFDTFLGFAGRGLSPDLPRSPRTPEMDAAEQGPLSTHIELLVLGGARECAVCV